ncbi:MAG: GNAT family N-acetyltransferase [Mesorhizobium amorphae]|nr:MAG: GNAT family N-acetyltransferase [Mesorhizobium amorphae]
MNAHAAAIVLDERVEVVRGPERLAAIEGEWTRLWGETDALVFQSHGWISAWWRAAGAASDAKLRIGLVWRGERLVAVVPLAIARRKGVRFLEWAAAAYSDYGDILRAPGCSDEALGRLWEAMRKGGGFDLVFINRLAPKAAANAIFGPSGPHGAGFRANHRREESSRIGGEWKDGAAWLASHPKKPRQNYRRGIKQMEETGPVRFRMLDPDEPRGPVLERLAALKRGSLEGKEHASPLFDPGSGVLAALVDVLAQAGILRLFVIEVGDKAVAISVNFVQRGTLMAWVTTYDPAFARASPGTVLIYDYVQWAFDQGLHTVDLLCGGEAFKDRLATHTETLSSVTLARTVKGSLALLADGLRRRLRERGATDAAAPAAEAS